MTIKADYQEINNTVLLMDENYNTLNSEIDNILKNLDGLKNLWQGEDADIYYNNAIDYMNNMKSIPEIYKSLSDVIKTMNQNYKELDKDYATSLEKAVVKHE